MKASKGLSQNSNVLMVEKKTHIELILNRPKSKNAIDLIMAKELQILIKDLKEKSLQETTPKILVLRSSDPHVFCAGGDLKAYAKMQSKAEGVKVNRLMSQNLEELSQLSFYSIAFVQGLCVGGGCEFVLACDTIWSTTSAEFVFGQARVGLTPGWGGGSRLAERVGRSAAKKYLLTSKKIFAAEALDSGLVDILIDDLDREVKTLAEDLPLDRQLLSAIKNVICDPAVELSQFEKLWWSEGHKEKLKKFVDGKN